MNYDETKGYSNVTGEVHQIHIEIPMEMHTDLKNALPEKGMISLIIRQLIRQFLKQVHDGMNPMNVFKKEGINESKEEELSVPVK